MNEEKSAQCCPLTESEIFNAPTDGPRVGLINKVSLNLIDEKVRIHSYFLGSCLHRAGDAYLWLEQVRPRRRVAERQDGSRLSSALCCYASPGLAS